MPMRDDCTRELSTKPSSPESWGDGSGEHFPDDTDLEMYEGFSGTVHNNWAGGAGNTVRYLMKWDRYAGVASRMARTGGRGAENAEGPGGVQPCGYYHSGINRSVFVQWIAEERRRGMQAGGMVNAHSAAQPSLRDAYKKHPGVPIVMDSGSFQGGMTAEDYGRVQARITMDLSVQSIFDRFDWIAGQDKIGCQRTTVERFEEMKRRGLEPLYIHQISAGTTLKDVPHYIQNGGLIGIGGLVRLIHQNVAAAMRVIEKIGRDLDRHGYKGHFFGVGSYGILRHFAEEEWFGSADSQKWLAGQKARKLYTKDGGSLMAEAHNLHLSRETCARQNMRQVARWASKTGRWADRWKGRSRLNIGRTSVRAERLGLMLTEEEIQEHNRSEEHARPTAQVSLFDPVNMEA